MMSMYLLSLTTGSTQGEKASILIVFFGVLIDHLPEMMDHLEMNDDASAVMDMHSGAESECGCVLTGSTQS